MTAARARPERGGGVGEGERGHRAGFVALLGPPNAGKSTLLNRLLGEKLAIVSARPQTTRSRILGILTRPGVQLMLVDTPGLHEVDRKFERALNDAVLRALGDCDVALLLVDRSHGWEPAHSVLLERARSASTPVGVVATKCDLKPRASVAWPPAEIADSSLVIETSGRTGAGVAALIEVVAGMLPLSPPLYPEDALTDRPLRWLCAELVREAAFELLQQELPYSLAVEVMRFDESRSDVVEIHADLLVARASHKRIAVGAGGSMIKRIGMRARREIERLLARRVHLQLFVKVDRRWLESGHRLESLGYH